MQCDPHKEHFWLKKFVGEWTFESECSMGPDQPKMKTTGSESVRMLGDLWVIGEGRGEMPGGGEGRMIITVGYDPGKKKFVGSWVGSMMPNMFVYEGVLDPTSTILPLETTGPDFADPTKTAKYRDTVEFKSEDHRVLTSSMLGDDGKWHTIMTAHYKRKK